MKQFATISLIVGVILALVSFSGPGTSSKLRRLYSKPITKWPKPNVMVSDWKELAALPQIPIDTSDAFVKRKVELGKLLFFDTRLSGSGKLSCASCHQPELSWTDGKEKSLGHEGTVNKRNSPTIQNSWFYSRLFWDGRSHDLEDQAFAPINSESEMHHDMRTLPLELKKVKAYREKFESAFGDPAITSDRIASAIAIFERTIRSADSRFDAFIHGNKKVLSDEEILGLHVFRTKAGCMNCHHGPFFSDDHFHNNGFAGKDQGYYKVTHNETDMGRFKTPSLRDVRFTGPYMHDGMQKTLPDIINSYDVAKHQGNMDQLIQPLHLTASDRAALLAFLQAISSPPVPFQRPILPE